MATNPAHLATDCIHGGQHADPTTGAVMPPIYTSSTFIQESPGVHKGYEYSRSHNATRFAFERCLATLERSGLGEDAERTCGGFAFASGLAAIATALELMDAGDTIVCMDDVYGGTNRLLNRVRKRSAGYKVVHVDLSDLGKAEAAIREHRPRMVWLETPTNPTLKLVDIEAVCRLARAAGAVSVVDNTFATPMLTRPIELGADIGNDLPPDLDVGLVAPAELLGGRPHRRDAEVVEPLLELRRRHDRHDLPVQAAQDRVRQVRGREQPVPRRALEARDAAGLLDGRHLGQRGDGLARGHGERPEHALLDRPHDGDRLVPHHLRLA